jgi:hypothetical protein
MKYVQTWDIRLVTEKEECEKYVEIFQSVHMINMEKG